MNEANEMKDVACPRIDLRVAAALVILALTLRLGFTAFLAQPFWGRPDPQIDYDTPVFFTTGTNLLRIGSLTCNPQNEYGYFCKMPGYPIFLAAISVVAGGAEQQTYRIVAGLQVALDSLATLLVLGIGVRGMGSLRLGYIAAFLYATYPFIIAWTPVVMSEALAIDLLLLAVYAIVARPAGFWPPAAAGIALAASALCRPQVLLFAPVAACAFLVREGPFKERSKQALIVLVFCGSVFGLWPARNLILHGRILATQDLRGWPTPKWDEDVLGYRRYIYSVKEDWEPQFGQIVRGEPVAWPAAATTLPGDASRLEQAVHLARTCGNGFRHWAGLAGPVTAADCSSRVGALFNELRERQIALNPWHFWVQVPLSNLRKALFKMALQDQRSQARRVASWLFPYRSALLIGGVAGALLALRRRDDPRGLMFLCLIGFAALYLVLCFGTGEQLRNIEMRYLLPGDVLLLFPAAYLGRGRSRPRR